MNSGYILGIVRQTGRPVPGALVCLDWIRTGESQLPTYSTDADGAMDRLRSVRRGLGTEMPPPTNPRTETNSDGAFMLPFQWDPGQIGTAAGDLFCQIFVLTEERTSQRVTMRMRGRFHAPMITTVSLSQVSSGLIPNPAQWGGRIGLGVDIYTVLRGIRRPMIGLTIAPMSPENYALVAGFRINL